MYRERRDTKNDNSEHCVSTRPMKQGRRKKKTISDNFSQTDFVPSDFSQTDFVPSGFSQSGFAPSGFAPTDFLQRSFSATCPGVASETLSSAIDGGVAPIVMGSSATAAAAVAASASGTESFDGSASELELVPGSGTVMGEESGSMTHCGCRWRSRSLFSRGSAGGAQP